MRLVLRWSLPVNGVLDIKLILRIVYIVALICAMLTITVSIPKGVDTDLFSLIGDHGFISQIANKSSTIIRAIPVNDAGQEACKASGLFKATNISEKWLEMVRTHGKGLLSEKHRTQLIAGETNRIIRAALRRNYVGVGIFPTQDDPFYLLNDFVSEFAWMKPKAEVWNGEADLNETTTREKIMILIESAHKGEVQLSGAPFHTLLATEKTKREINGLGAISLIAVLFFGWRLFGNLKFVIPMIMALSCGLLMGSAVVFATFERPHALTFLFGTSLIGLGVDYCYHALNTKFSGTNAQECMKNLTAALLTTILAFSPLLGSSISVLNQMAVFTIVGLIAIYGWVGVWCVK